MAGNFRVLIKEEIAGLAEESLEKHFDQIEYETEEIYELLNEYMAKNDLNEDTEIVEIRDKVISLLEAVY